MRETRCFRDDIGDKYRYVLCYIQHGWDEAKYGNDLDELDRYAKEMKEENSGKPLIIVNGNDEIEREYAKKLR